MSELLLNHNLALLERRKSSLVSRTSDVMKFCERMSSTNFGCDEMIGYPDNWVSRGIFLEAVKGESQTAEFQKKTGSGMAEMEKLLRRWSVD